MTRPRFPVLLPATLLFVAAAADEEAWIPLFDGRSLEGWQAARPEFWTVEDGAITATATAERMAEENEYIVWQGGKVSDFELELEFRIGGEANSGIQFRSRISPEGRASGYEADILPGGPWLGAVVDERAARRNLLAENGQRTEIDSLGRRRESDLEGKASLRPAGEWNDYHILARGHRVVLRVNGTVSAELIDHEPEELHLEGILGLQLRADSVMKAQFRNIRLRRLAPAGSDPAPEFIVTGENPESVCRGFDGRLYFTVIHVDEPGDGGIDVVDDDRVRPFCRGMEAPKGLAFVGGHLVTADENTVWKVDSEGKAERIAGPGDFPEAVEFLNDVAASLDGESVYVTEMTHPQRMFRPDAVRALWPVDGEGATLTRRGCVYRVGLDGSVRVTVPPGDPLLPSPNGIAVSGEAGDETLWLGDFFTGNLVRWDGDELSLVTEGLRGADGVAVDGDTIYISSWHRGLVWRHDRGTGETEVLADDFVTAADFLHDAIGNRLIVPDMVAGRLVFVPLGPSPVDPEDIAVTGGAFESLFDGKSLAGWKAMRPDYWSVEDGVITARSTPENPCTLNQFLVWQGGDVADFELKLKFRLENNAGNSGIQFRSRLSPEGLGIGYQADILPGGPWLGAVVDEHATRKNMLAPNGQKTIIDESGARRTSRLGPAVTLRPAGEWNDYHVIARGHHIRLAVNGRPAAEVVDHQAGHFDAQGILGLQLRSGPPMQVQFKDILYRSLDVEGDDK